MTNTWKRVMMAVVWGLGCFWVTMQEGAQAAPWTPRTDCSGMYGFKDDQKALDVTLAQVAKAPQTYEGKFLQIKGLVFDVCQMKGCWLMLSDGHRQMRVRFKGYKFFVPTNSKGYAVTVRGYARVTIISEKMARHYAEDSGDLEAAKKIVGPQKALTFMAHNVTLAKVAPKALTPQAPPKALTPQAPPKALTPQAPKSSSQTPAHSAPQTTTSQPHTHPAKK